MTKICLMCGDTFPDTISFCAKDGSALRAAVVGDHLIGEVFCDRYVVTDLLGEGGMGAVYAARDVRLPQQVAIKVLREQGMADPSTVARFRQEAEAASRINHDRVARVTDFGFMSDGRAFLVMEFVGGRTLKQIVSDRGAMDAADVSRIVTMVAEGLDAAHRLGIIHRDLKPDNVMILDDAGGGVRVKVLDFGIAKVLQGNEESAGQTKTGFVIGTPQWMSPEQILGETPDGRSDVYALALLAYFMLTGQRAFEQASAEVEMMARLTSTARPLTEIRPTVTWPAGLQELFNRTLSRDVQERPSGALAFAREFASVAAAAPDPVTVALSARSLDALAGTLAGTPQPRVPAAATPSAAVATTPIATSRASTASSFNEAASVTTAKRSRLVPIVMGVAVVAALAFFAVKQFAGSDNSPTNTAAGSANPSTVEPSTRDSVDRGAANALRTEPPVVAPSIVDGSQTATTPKPSGGQSSAPTAGAGRAGGNSTGVVGAGSDSARPVVPRGTSAAPGGNRDAANAAPTSSTNIELDRLLAVADVELNGKDSDAIRDIIRKLELLMPKLVTAKDQGNAHLYIAMSQATLGDNTKACASINRAEPLAVQSPALRSNVQQWHQLLRCFQ